MKRILALAALLLLAAVSAASAHAADPVIPPQPRDYLDLPAGKKFQKIPYVWEREAHGKHIAVIGTHHNRDPRAPMFDRIEAVFKRVRPQLVIHESDAPPELLTLPRDQAINAGADLGFAVYLTGRYGAIEKSGDAPVKDEIRALLAHYPAADVLVFLTVQRLIGSVPHPDLQAAAAGYPDFVRDYLVGNGLPMQPGWESWDYFLRDYARVVGRPLRQESWDRELVNPTRNSGRLNQIVRTSCAFRDSYLVATIKSALHEHDRVVVVFGSWHVLALEPVLDGMLTE